MNHITIYFLNEYHPLVALTSIGKVSRKVRISEGDLFSLFASRQNQPENELQDLFYLLSPLFAKQRH